MEKNQMNLRNALIAAAVVAAPFAIAPGVAQAQPLNGVYIGAGAGVNWLTDTNIRAPGSGKLKSDVGVVGLGSVGYAFGNGFRVELEGNYRYQRVKANGVGGELQSYGPMVNVLYDFDAGLGWATPYVGVGVGYQWGEIRGGGVSTDSDGAWAGQGILGAAFAIPDVPGLAVTAEARVLGTFEKVKYGNGSTDPQLNVSGLLGLRYNFGVVAPVVAAAPAAVPAPAPARTYLVFFDWDKADLTPRARQIVADAAQASTRVATTRIEVAGHTDTSGTARYNEGLSLRRANSVAAELVRLGVARTAIDIQAFGQSRPLVATGDGVREPQNRRVEIVLR
jgi:outer membrane protein OmpA-like peptidoglycan-associated protein